MRSWLISIWFWAAFGVTAQAARGAEYAPRPAAENGGDTIAWGETNVVALPGVWGRMIQLTNGHWLCVSTRLARTNSTLQLRFSTDNARKWSLLSEVFDGGRFFDNGELIELPVGAAFSLSPSEGERAGVRGPRVSPMPRKVPGFTETPHPDLLPFGRGEGRFSRGFPTAYGSTKNGEAPVADGRRFLDNGDLIQLPDGAVLLTGRSLIEAESYRLPVYRSPDAGRTWNYLSNIDANEGAPGTLQARGLWEPHFYFLADGRLAVAYANEKHASEQPAFSQVCSVKISPDLGKSWGKEITLAAEPGGGELRPGMPVVERMANGRFLAVYEVVGIGDADVFCKTSDDGEHWPAGLGTRVSGHNAGPWVTSLNNGRILLTSCANVLSCSDDFARSWKPVNPPAWEIGPGKVFTWPAIYQTGSNEVAVMISRRGVHLRFGKLGQF